MEDVKPSSYCTVLDGRSQSKYLCYTHRRNALFYICLTDAADVWSTEYTEDTLKEFRQKFALKSTEDYILKLRSACVTGDVSVVVHDTRAELQVSSGSTDLSVSLSRLQGPQATEELKELLFRMADSLTQLDSKEFEPRQQQNCGPSVTVKRRAPGASLINPGTKKKMQATGVAFDEADDD
ncbi:protein PAXX isoform X3 [Limanda limanda]|uniref:protein PAXX isoform X3 n=1 Tax=Limanda limanda TaxID=27771 RepID=UPI0029C70C9E|nr:protein PAXX isoform X3 [Limanda limanda]